MKNQDADNPQKSEMDKVRESVVVESLNPLNPQSTEEKKTERQDKTRRQTRNHPQKELKTPKFP